MIIDMNYWIKVLRKIFILAITILGIYFSFKLAIFYMPFLIAFIISLIIEPVIRFLMKKIKLGRKVSAITVFILVLGIIIGLLVWGIMTLITEASNLLNNLNNVFNAVYQISQDLISKIDFSRFKLSEEVMNIISNSASDFIGTVSVWIKNALTSLLNKLTSLPTIGLYIVITILALYFICTDRIYILDQIEHHLPAKWVRKMWKHSKDLISSLGCYLKAEATLVIISFVISTVGFYIFKFMGMNIEYPLIIALAIAFVDALPIFGSGTIMVPWSISLACNGDIRLGISILVLWIIMSIVRQLVEPRIVSKQIGIHPIFTLIAMYTGFKVSGVLGLVAGPIVLIILKNIFATNIDKGFMKFIFDREI